jgi:hypothetical protein
MERTPRALLGLVLSAAIAGCGGAPKIARTPNSGHLPTADLKLALVLTDKTRESVKGLHTLAKSKSAGSMADQSGAYANKPFDAINEVFRNNFAAVTMVDSAEQAKAMGADLIAVLDYDARAKNLNFVAHILFNIPLLDLPMLFEKYWNPRTTDLVANVTFLTPEQAQIEMLHAEAHRQVGPFTFIPEIVVSASEEVGIRFENALAASEALAAYARQRAKLAPAAAAPVAVEPAKPAGPTSDVDAPTYVAEEKATNFAIVVGIEKYSGIPDAEFAERDAAAMQKHLIALGYPERNILFLTGEQATRSAIQKYVEIWLPKNVKADSQVFFYFSGHGAPDPASKQAYLVPWDGDPKFLENTGYPIAKLYKSLGALKAKKVLVALDSCFSGAGGRSVLAQGTRPLVMKIDSSIPAGAENISILSASAGDQISGSDNAQGHGLFTYYLLRSLNRSGGKASVKDAYASLVPDVEDAARRQNRAQTPQLASGSEAAFFR